MHVRRDEHDGFEGMTHHSCIAHLRVAKAICPSWAEAFQAVYPHGIECICSERPRVPEVSFGQVQSTRWASSSPIPVP